MKFGHCEECRNYRMLVSDGLCRTHATGTEINVGVRMMGDAVTPSRMSEFSEIVHSDLRTVETEDNFDAIIVMTDLEIVVEDELGDPVQTFDYSEYEKNIVTTATQDAVDWISQNVAV